MGSGPVIISAKTRRREYSPHYSDYQVDGFPSCKHMCCREGIDKVPKAPKSSFVPAASLVDSSHVSVRRGKDGRVATTKKSVAPRVAKHGQEVEIETVDLASRQTLGSCEKTPPEAFRSLNRLHDNVTKGRTAPVATKKQPSFDYTKGGQPQISFPGKNASVGKSSNKPSTDYDADWIEDLPSPSALLGKPRETPDSLPEHTSTDYGSSWPDGLPSPSALIPHNDAATRSYPDNDSLEDFDLSHFNDDGSELEAAMVGLSDSVTLQEDPQVQAATGQTGSHAKAFRHWSLSPDEPSPKLYHRPTFNAESSGTCKISSSREDSPEKNAELAQKRKADIIDEAEDLSQSAPVPKRPRVSDEGEAAEPSSSAEKQAKAPSSIIRAGQPGWVYGFDAAFIAEWQDIVDFV